MAPLRAWCARNRLALAVVAAGWLVRLTLILLGGQFCWPDEWRYYRGVELLSRMMHGEFAEPLRQKWALRLASPKCVPDCIPKTRLLPLRK